MSPPNEPAVASLSMSADEWAELDEGEPGELVAGRLEEEETPTALHEAVALWLPENEPED